MRRSEVIIFGILMLLLFFSGVFIGMVHVNSHHNDHIITGMQQRISNKLRFSSDENESNPNFVDAPPPFYEEKVENTLDNEDGANELGKDHSSEQQISDAKSEDNDIILALPSDLIDNGNILQTSDIDDLDKDTVIDENTKDINAAAYDRWMEVLGASKSDKLSAEDYSNGEWYAWSKEDALNSEETSIDHAQAVKNAMMHTWKGYEEHAFGADELLPISGKSRNNWGSLACTLVDSLDTLWLMGLKEEFNRAKVWIKNNLIFGKNGSKYSVFETTIRVLGGLLSAYDLSGEKVFLDKAIDLGNRLLKAFNTPSGVPSGQVALNGGASGGLRGGTAVLSEMGTLQVEFRYLSQASGDPKYAKISEKPILNLENSDINGLYPIHISTATGKVVGQTVTFGALGDSFYEYLLKVWIQGGLEESVYRTMYDKTMEALSTRLMQRTQKDKLLYIADLQGSTLKKKMDHLVCFTPGMLALGAASNPDASTAARDMKNARALMFTCYQMYKRMPTGIAPEYIELDNNGKDMIAGSTAAWYILRPEAVESLFILHHITGDPIYREWGWEMWSAIDSTCKTTYGYGSVHDVRSKQKHGNVEDRMESFWIAETLKYYWLLFSPKESHSIRLNTHVFNTEAHPLRSWGDAWNLPPLYKPSS